MSKIISMDKYSIPINSLLAYFFANTFIINIDELILNMVLLRNDSSIYTSGPQEVLRTAVPWLTKCMKTISFF